MARYRKKGEEDRVEIARGMLEESIPSMLLWCSGFRPIMDKDNKHVVVPLLLNENEKTLTFYDLLSLQHRMCGDVVVVPRPVVDLWHCSFRVYEGAARQWPEYTLEIGGSGMLVTPGAYSVPEREDALHTALKTLFLSGIGSFVVPTGGKYLLFSVPKK